MTDTAINVDMSPYLVQTECGRFTTLHMPAFCTLWSNVTGMVYRKRYVSTMFGPKATWTVLTCVHDEEYGQHLRVRWDPCPEPSADYLGQIRAYGDAL